MRDLWDQAARAPHDDALRLVVADQLEDRGECEWAELVRVQVALQPFAPFAREAEELRWRERVLLARGEGPWSAQLPRWRGARLGDWERGFPTRLYARDVDALRAAANELPAGISGLYLGELDTPELPPLPWLRELTVGLPSWELPMQALLDSELFAHGLVELELRGLSLSEEDLEALFASPRCAELRSLGLHRVAVRPDAARMLAASPYLSQLRELALIGSPFEDPMLGIEGLEVLLGWQRFPQLEELRLSNQGIGAEGIRMLLSSPGALRVLSLRMDNPEDLQPAEDGGMRLVRLITDLCDLTDEDLQALLDSPALHEVASLVLSQNSFRSELFSVLTSSRAWPGLRELDIRGDYQSTPPLSPLTQVERGPAELGLSYALGAADLAKLSQAPWWKDLRALSLDSVLPPDEGTDAWPDRLPRRIVELKWPTWDPALARAALPDLVSFDGDAVSALLQAPWISGLARLSLPRSPEGTAAALVEAGARSLHHLELSYSALSPEDLEALIRDPVFSWLLTLDLSHHGLSPDLFAPFLEPGVRPLLRELEGLHTPAFRVRFWERA